MPEKMVMPRQEDACQKVAGLTPNAGKIFLVQLAFSVTLGNFFIIMAAFADFGRIYSRICLLPT